eukprot:sb/3471956/
MSTAEKKRLASLDHRPVALRAAIKRNTQMNRQLSKVRNSLRNEERESQQLLKRGNHQLVAKLNALRIIKEIKSPQPPKLDSRKESLDKINTRSNSQRKKLYRQPTQQMIPEVQPDIKEAQSATPPSTDQTDKYQMPSWKRAELMMKQQKEDERNTKIYGKRGGGRTRNSNSKTK